MNNAPFPRKALKYFFLPLLLLSVFSYTTKPVAVKAAPQVITTKQSETYINNYYSTISPSLTGSNLASALESLLKAERNSSFNYDSLQTTAFPYTDVDPTRPHDGYIVSFYSGKAVKGYNGMNKEHTWPNSHGGNKIENDPHMVRPTISAENSSRGNEYFSNTAAGWDPASLGDVTARGMSARIILYGAVIGKSGGLVLEDVGRGQGTGTGNKMGKLGDLLRWNLEYPVNQKEIIRNETLDSSLNYNRNPFIDRPEYACAIWGNTNTNTQNICASQTPVAVDSISITPSYDTINLLSTNTGTQLTANILPENATNKTVTWTSSNNNVASVSGTGYVSAKTVGQATIFATSVANGNKVAQASIVVVSETTPVSGVTLNKQSTTIQVGGSEILTPTVVPSGATNKAVSWSSSDPSVVSVTNGIINGLKKGSGVVSVTTTDGNFTASTLVTVTDVLPTTIITGSFYNDTTSNTGGEVSGDDNFKNLMNNGSTGVNTYSGFGGNAVIKALTATQLYLPRGGGLALGSSKASGTLNITLHDDYAATKIEVFINSSVSDASASLSSSHSIKTNRAGTNGDQYSDPSSTSYKGTPYILEFNENATSFTIGTTKRMIVVAIRLTIINTTPTPSPSETATNWANNFLAITDTGCATSNASLLLSAWQAAEDTYLLLQSEAQQIIINTNPNYDINNPITHAKARYFVILNQYHFNDFINGEVPLNNELQSPATLNNSTLLVLIGLLAVISVGYYLVRLENKNRYH